MIDIERFVLAIAVERNPLFKIHLMAMKLFGYMIFYYQTYWRLHCFRGMVLSISFVVFNIAQVLKLPKRISTPPLLSNNQITLIPHRICGKVDRFIRALQQHRRENEKFRNDPAVRHHILSDD